MQTFMNKDFLLKTDTAKTLYHHYASKMPIFDFHNHLSAKEIYQNRCFDNMAQAWLDTDHYKWRAMRTFGIKENLITYGDGFARFTAWARTVQHSIGNPLYHWTHLELQRYFQVETPLSETTAKDIWENCKERLSRPEYSVQGLLCMQGVKALCTTDDPADDLEYHKKLKDEGFWIQVLPTFRPDRVLDIEKEEFMDYIRLLGCGYNVQTLESLLKILCTKLDYFISAGCLASDHSIEGKIFTPVTFKEADRIYQKRQSGSILSPAECSQYRSYVLTALGKEYAQRGIVMQLHIGALRNNPTRMFHSLGPNAGFDSMDDRNYAAEISCLLNAMDITNQLPKTILYCLNPKDNEMLASLAGSFQGGGIQGKIQLGPAWWFNDSKTGIECQMDVLSTHGLLSTFAGMLTDSRSFLSFPRHEYFRRILCNKIGAWVESGEYPADMDFLGNLVENISYRNAVQYFGL